MTSNAWGSFRDWRRSRPFWGAVVLALGGWYILSPVAGNWHSSITLGVGGVSGYILGLGILAAAGIALFMPAQRHFPAIMAAIMSVASLPLANLGGWIIGMALGIVGAGLVFAWTPYTEDELRAKAERAVKRGRAKEQGTKEHDDVPAA